MIGLVPPRLICLDAGGVLVNPNWRRIAHALSRHGVRAQAVQLEAAAPHAKRELDSGPSVQASDDQSRGWRFFELVLARAGFSPGEASRAAFAELADYHARSNLWESVPADAVPTLRRLRARGAQLAVVSNANGTLATVFARLGLAPLFDLLVDSRLVGVEKPDPAIFAGVLEKAGVAPGEALHLGDLYHVDVVGARAAGLEAWLLDDADLYPEADCPRAPSLTAFADALEARA